MTSILLTGSTRGIGAATHTALIAAGATVVGHGSRESGPAGVIGIDLAAPGAGDRLWDAALERLGGRIDVLVNNAGVFEAVAPDAPDVDWAATWRRSLAINLQAAADLSRRAVRHFQAQVPDTPDAGGVTGRPDAEGVTGRPDAGGVTGRPDAGGVTGRPDAGGVTGRIINVASRAAFRGDSPDHWHYAAAKAGMVAMTRTIARAYAAHGILAFVVAPGFTLTGMAEDYLSRRGGDALVADIPLGRVATAAEVAETIRWLALDAPPSLTGAVLDVNGASYVR